MKFVHASAVAVFVEWWIVVFVDICSSIFSSAVVLLQYTLTCYSCSLLCVVKACCVHAS